MGHVLLSGTRTSPGLARTFLRRELGRHQVASDPTETALLLASELVTNAVLHARTELVVRCEVTSDCIRVEVEDGSRLLPLLDRAAVDAVSGRGLCLVADLAHAWGVEPLATGKKVWFETLR